MNSALMMPATVPRLHMQLPSVSSRKNMGKSPALAFAAAIGEKKPAYVLAPVLMLLIQPDVSPQSELAIQERLVRALQQKARAQERLICEAETALACQSVRTYRQWYSHWRCRGVRVNDLLDMTWVWRQRTTAS